MKGKKELSKRTIILSIITIAYIISVFTAVFLGRIVRDNRAYILLPFYSYRAAWNGWSPYDWRGIILNIAMFVPFGFLLPLWSEKLQSFWKICLVSFLSTLFIEGVQYFSRIGVFEVDDLIHNTLGALIGYGGIMIILAINKKKRLKAASVLLYLSPALLTVVVFAAIFISYSSMEMGTLITDYIYPVNMDKIKVASDISYDTERDKAIIYKAPYFTVSEAENFTRKFFESIGSNINEDGNFIDDEYGIFYSDDRSRHMWVTFRGGTYNYSDFDYNSETATKAIKVSEEDARKALSDMRIYVPKKASFQYDNMENWFVFEVDLVEEQEYAFAGTLIGKYYEDGTVKEINNDMMSLKFYRETEIISEEEAFKKIIEGKFMLWQAMDYKISSITINDLVLDYVLDSKAYYQPVYRFTVTADGEEDTIIIPAIK